MTWNITVAVICLVLLGFALWKEVVRVNKSYLVLRITAVIVAVLALACIIIPITYKTDQPVLGKHEAILLTDGFSADSLNKYPDAQIFTTSPQLKKEQPKAVLLNTLTAIKTEYPDLKGLHVLGYGLDEDELKQLGNTPVTFHPAAQPAGISSVSWDHHLKSGEVLKVQGKFNDPGNKNYLVILKGLNVTLDSVAVKASGNFELQSTPKTTGNTVYRLIVKSGQDTLENESLPLHIEPVKSLKVLILASSPDFENRFLKNWLSANGYAVYVRTAISKDKYSTEAVNAAQMVLTSLSSTTLQNFDVVVGDQLALQNLNAAETSVLRQQVTQKGLGLIVRADSTGKNDSWFQGSFPVYRISSQIQTSSALSLSGQTGTTAALKLDPANIVYKPGTQVLVSDAKNRALVSVTMVGAGKVVFSTLNSSYSWMLAGDDKDYTAYWSLLVGKASRKQTVQKAINVSTDFPVVGQEINLEVSSPSVPDSVAIVGIKPAFAQSATIPFLWQAKYWAAKAGWQSITNIYNNASDIYVFDDNDWLPLKNTRKIFVTNAYTNKNLLNYTHEQLKADQISRQIPKIWFYLLFVIACTFLWAEAKFSSR